VEEALGATRKTMESGGGEEINKAIDNLTQASHKLAEAMYKSSSQPGGQGPDGQGPGGQASGADGQGPAGDGAKPKDDVVDAEFVDVDEKKK
jgi:molecular chaperone DnaK